MEHANLLKGVYTLVMTCSCHERSLESRAAFQFNAGPESTTTCTIMGCILLSTEILHGTLVLDSEFQCVYDQASQNMEIISSTIWLHLKFTLTNIVSINEY